MTAPEGYNPADYPPFAVTVDVVLFSYVDDRLHVLMIERGQDPWKGRLALPGGFVDEDEDLPDAAVRELKEETGITAPADLVQLGAYGDPDRDPRMRIVSVAYWAFVDELDEPKGGDDAADALLVPVDEVLTHPDRLASDHHLIVTDAVKRL